MAFAAYLDESGLDDRSATFWMGGYVGQLPEWFEFSRHWRRMLKNAGIPFFRMSEFANPAGRYRGWSTEDKNALCAEATGIINSVDVWGLGAGVVKADYERVIVAGDFLERAGLRRGWWSHPFLLAFTECVLDVVKLARRLPAGKVVAFICDRQETYQARVHAAFADFQCHESWRDRLGTLSFRDKTEALELQAADLLVYELRKRLDQKLLDPATPIRKSMQRLTCRLASSPYVTEDAMRRIVTGSLETGSFQPVRE